MPGLSHGWDYPDDHADYQHGGVDVDDFAPDFKHKKKSSKNRPKKRPGCPENGFGAHVYIWTTEYPNDRWTHPEDLKDFHKFYGFYKWEFSLCAGCGKVNPKRRRRFTDEFVKHFRLTSKNSPWFSSPERQDEAFIRFATRNHRYYYGY